MNKKIFFALFISCILISTSFASPKISIIIDDLGYNLQDDLLALNLPGNIEASIIPKSPNATKIAELAHEKNKEIIMHVPMQALKHEKIDRGALLIDMNEAQVKNVLRSDLQTVPFAKGISNHEGSLYTQKKNNMNWVMSFLLQKHLFFFDSHTFPHDIAESVAKADHVPTTGRDIFLDDIKTPASIAQQFQLLIQLAKKNGSAVAIGHPNKVTLQFLQEELPKLSSMNIELVPLSQQVLPHPITSVSAQTSISEVAKQPLVSRPQISLPSLPSQERYDVLEKVIKPILLMM